MIQALALATISSFGGHLVHEAHVAGHQRADLLALEQHLQGVAGLHQAGDPLRAAGPGEQPDLDLGQADAGRLRVGQDAVVAGERQLEGAAETDPVHRDGEGFSARLEPAVEERQAARLLEECRDGGFLALVLGELAIERAEALQHGQVGAAREGLLAGSDDAALDRFLARDVVDQLRQLVHHLRGDDVHGAPRHVPGRERDAVAVRLDAEVLQVHGGLPNSRVILGRSAKREIRRISGRSERMCEARRCGPRVSLRSPEDDDAPLVTPAR